MHTYLDEILWEIDNEQYETGSIKYDGWLNSLPWIICGPILRKVYYDHVSVWLAFKEEVSNISLEVFEVSNPSKIILSGTIPQPIMLGKNLFVSLVTALSTGAKLSSDIIYGYKISFTLKVGPKKQLSDPNVLKGGIESIVYKPFDCPTFCLPSDNINHLKIVHGSCRKAHGGTTDALRALDTMIEISSNNAAQRPQLLCLTGDQIYADDVSDILLHKIIEVQKSLLGWEEKLPKNYTASQLLPGNRKNIIARTGNKNMHWGFGTRSITPDDLTTTDADSHLIHFSEFILMYLFAFSEVMWSYRNPSWKELYPDLKQPKRGENLSEYVNTFKARSERFRKDTIHLNSFVKSLPFVRKAVANVSVLMILDDHDITDDWFITKEWSGIALLKGTTSRRYILNGLLAYAIFQDWGNNFSKYISGNGKSILNSLDLKISNNYIKNISIYPNPFANDIECIVLPVLCDDTKNSSEPSWFLKNNMRWDYHIAYNSFNLFVLNTRTERQYFEKEKPLANLIKSIHPQGQFDIEKLAVFVSAVPIFSNIPLEIRQDQCREGKSDLLTGFICRHEDIIGMFEKDQESWSFSGRGFGNLLYFLSLFKKVLILSGDVHHAFTSYVNLWRKIGSEPYHLTKIVQSTSSALKNSTDKTHYPAINKYGLGPDANKLYKRIKILGRTKPGQNFEKFSNPRFEDPQEYNPAVTRIRLESVTPDPRLQYTVKFIRSAGYGVSKNLALSILKTSQAKKFTDNNGRIYPVPGTVVGKDNISLISFTQNSILNSIWLANGTTEKPDEGRKGMEGKEGESARLLFPYINHLVDLSVKPNLSELPIKEVDKLKGQAPAFG